MSVSPEKQDTVDVGTSVLGTLAGLSVVEYFVVNVGTVVFGDLVINSKGETQVIGFAIGTAVHSSRLLDIVF